MRKYILVALLGAFVGLLGGLQGQAGSIYILTGLLVLGILKTQREAAGTTLLYTSVPLTLGAAYEYYKKGDIDVDISVILITTAIIFSYLGAKLNYYISPRYVNYSIAATTLLSSFYFFYRGYMGMK